MTFSSIVAIIGGIVTAGCAIAGAIAGIRARRAQEARNEEIRNAEHRARLSMMTNSTPQNNVQNYPSYVNQPQQPVRGEIHHYYHGFPQQSENNMYSGNNWNNNCYSTYQQNINRQYGNFYNPDAYTQNQNNNNWYNGGGYNNYAYGSSYGSTEYKPYRYEKYIGDRSKMEMMRNSNYYNSTGYNNYNSFNNGWYSNNNGYGDSTYGWNNNGTWYNGYNTYKTEYAYKYL